MAKHVVTYVTSRAVGTAKVYQMPGPVTVAKPQSIAFPSTVAAVVLPLTVTLAPSSGKAITSAAVQLSLGGAASFWYRLKR